MPSPDDQAAQARQKTSRPTETRPLPGMADENGQPQPVRKPRTTDEMLLY